MNIPALNGNWIDLCILVVMVFYLLGWKRGFIIGLIDLLGFFLSFVAALRAYSFFGGILIANFSLPQGIANAAGFFIAGIIVEIIFSLAVNIFISATYLKIMQKTRENKNIRILARIDKAFGIMPALGEGIIFTAFILTLIMALPVQPKIKKDITESRIGSSLVSKTQTIEKRMNIIFGEAVNETLTFLTINPSSEETIQLRFAVNETSIDMQAEKDMFILVNDERAKNGIKPLIVDDELTELAREYAKDMFTRGYFSHYNPENQSPFERMEENNIQFLAAGENLALAPNVNLAHQGLMNSEGHRENILSQEFGKVGIGVVDGGIYGQMYVQEFTN